MVTINVVMVDNDVSMNAVYACPEIGPAEHAALAHIDRLRKELRFYVAEPMRWMGPVRKVLAARAIQGSNSIEGYDVSVEDAVAAIEGGDPAEADSEAWQAVGGYRRAMTFVLQMARGESFGYSGDIFRSLHFMMTEYDLDASPGLWRPGPIWVRNDQSGEIVYEGPEHEAVPELVDTLIDQLETDVGGPAIVRGAMAHLNLVMIHPFRDGNGRMARCLQTLVLAREDTLVPEFCSIEEYLGRNTQSYYDILGKVGQGAWNPRNDARPWLRYCLRAHYVQAASVLRRVRESEKIWGYLEDEVAGAGLPERAIEGLFDASLGLQVKNSSYRASTRAAGEQISNQTATTDLRQMVDAGLLDRKGAKRGTYYVGSSPLVEFYGRLRAAREPIVADHIFTPITDPEPRLF